MKQNLSTLFLISLLFTACSTSQNRTSATERSLALKDCALSTSYNVQVDARCGTLNVPEDRTTTGGRQIALNIAVIPAIKHKPAPDPLFLLAGGPGQ